MLSEKEIAAKIRRQQADERMISETNWSSENEFAKDFGKECIEAAHDLLTEIIESNVRLENLNGD